MRIVVKPQCDRQTITAPVLRNTRMPVQTIVDDYDAGMLPAAIAEAWDVSLKEVHDILDYREVRLIQQRMLERATQHLISQGVSADEAKKLATAALSAPPEIPLPTF